MTELATLTWDADTFYFVSDDGDHFYEVAPRPPDSASVDHLRPFGIRKSKDGTRLFLISMARAYLRRIGTEPGKAVEFSELP